jgi:hypothetical protein
MAEAKIEKLAQLANELPNLQLLEGPANIEKRAELPAEWLAERYPTEYDREHYRSIHLLCEMPNEIEGCEVFWASRREQLREKITAVLNHRPEVTGALAEGSELLALGEAGPMAASRRTS